MKTNKVQEYQNAFASIKPSEQAVEAALDYAKAPRRTGRPALRIALVAAVIALLVGSVYGVSQWIRFRAADEFPTASHAEQDTVFPEETWPAPQTVMEFDAQKGSTYIGFMLPDSYAENADPVSSYSLELLFREKGVDGATLDKETLSKAYAHYRSKDDAPNLLAIEVLDNGATDYRAYFSRYDIRVEQEGEIAGMDGMWIYTKVFDLDTYNLFLKSEPNGCIVVVSSTASFEAAEQAARDLALVDSGAPVVNAYDDMVYAVKLREAPPEGLTVWETAAMDKMLEGSEIADPALDLTELYDSHTLSRPGLEGSFTVMVLSNETDFPAYMTEENYCILQKEEPLAGGTARWYENTFDEGSTVLVIHYADQAVNVVIDAVGVFREEYKSDLLWFVSSMELVGIPIGKAAPAEFNILAAG